MRYPGKTRPGDFLEPRQRVVIVGDGILGNMIATELCAASPSLDFTTVGIDENVRPKASDGSLVWLNVVSTETEDYARLRVASMRLWQDLAGEEWCPVRLRGSLLWDRDREGLEALARFQNSVGWDVRIIERDEFQTLAPGIVDPPAAALYAPDEGSAFPQWIMNWADPGPDIKGVVETVLIEEGRAKGVRLTNGLVVEADHVVLAAGAGTSAILESVSVDLPMRDAPGMCLWTEPLPHIAGPVVASPGMDFWQDDDGRVIIATGTHDTMVDDLETTVDRAIARLKAMAPAAENAKVGEAMIRQRPIPADGLPALGSPKGIGNLHVAVCHSGMTLAPIIAKIVRAGVEGCEPPVDIAPFHIDRFAKDQT